MKTLVTIGVKDSVVRRIMAIRPDTSRLWGKMSAAQMVCHLTDSFCSMMGERKITTVRYRRGLLYPALYLPLRWPKGTPTRPEVDQLGGGTKPGAFAEDVARLVSALDKFASPSRDFTFQPHPIFGPMSEWQWMRWGYLHTDHHLRQFGG
jgi:hypothetical protein